MKHISIDSLPLVGVTHNPDIKKKVILDRGYIPQLMMFGQATFQPGQSVEAHKHATMYEVFYVQSGKAVFVIEGNRVDLIPGDCISIEPNELHTMENPYAEPATWLYFGIATD